MWQVLPGQSLRHRSWNDESVVYNDLTGDTHLLGADALAVLLALKDGALALPALCQALDIDPLALDALAAHQPAAELVRVLHQLRAIFLVEELAC